MKDTTPFDFKIPWHWDFVKLDDYKNEYIYWCIERSFKYGVDYVVHTTDEFERDVWTEWGPYKRHHYLFFKDPLNLSVFMLTFI
jgi:hypothetical protein